MTSTIGVVTIDCPGCHRRVTFPIYAAGPVEQDHGSLVMELTLDMDAVTAHLLTHGLHDGEPEPLNAAA